MRINPRRALLAGLVVLLSAAASAEEAARLGFEIHPRGRSVHEVILAPDGTVAEERAVSSKQYTLMAGAPVTGPLAEPAPIGTYRLALSAFGSDNRILVYEAMLDTRTGEVVSRRRIDPKLFDILREEDVRKNPRSEAAHPGMQRASSLFGPRTKILRYHTTIDSKDATILGRVRHADDMVGAPLCVNEPVDRRRARPGTGPLECLYNSQEVAPSGHAGPYQVAVSAWGPGNKVLVYEVVVDSRDGSVTARNGVSPKVFDLVERD
ncbi:MAG: hypothetical protein GY716_08255 [bacterium]|nr:hypothetical protein [bacterium]